MPWNSRLTSAPMHSYPCPACNRPIYRDDGHCRTIGCPNRIPPETIAAARETALADMRATIARSRTTRQENTP